MKELTPLEHILARFGIRPNEKALISLLFGNMFLSGLAIGMIRVCAFTLFLEHFASEQLALVAILLAITGTFVTLIIERATASFSTRGYIFVVLGTILGTVLILRLLLGTFENTSLIFVLPLIFEVLYMLFSLQFIALLTRLLNVRQTKRLSGLARSGEFAAETVGGISIIFLLNYMSVPDLLLVAGLAVLGVFAVVQTTIHMFSSKLTVTEEVGTSDQSGSMSSMLKMRYVQMIAFCYAAYIFAYFFLDVAFYKYAAIQFPNEQDLAGFIGQFFAMAGFLTMFTMIFVYAPFLRKFGLLAGVLIFPIMIGIGSTTVSSLEFTQADAAIIFIAMVVTNGLRVILQSAIWRPSVGILFQVLPDKQRVAGTSLIEGIVDPLSGGLAGLALYFISEKLAWEPRSFLLVLAALMAAWCVVAIFIRRAYLGNLVVSIRQRKLGELSISQLDNASLNIILRGLNSPYPAEVFYCLDTLEQLEHPDIANHMQYILANRNEDIRMDTLRRIARMELHKLSPAIKQRMGEESVPRVRGQVLRTYAQLGSKDTLTQLKPYLKDAEQSVREGALIGILCFSPKDDESQNHLLSMIRSDKVSDRESAARVIAEVGSDSFSGFLVELLEDSDRNVIDQAILAAGQVRDGRLTNTLVQKLRNPIFAARSATALVHIGEGGLYDLEIEFTSPKTQRETQRRIIEIVREIGTEACCEWLQKHVLDTSPELRHQIYQSLAALHFQAAADERVRYAGLLQEEVTMQTFLLASMEDVYKTPGFERLHAALAHEVDVHRDDMLLITSFIFPSVIMLDSRANIDSNVSELRVFALEVLDNLLTGEIKQFVIPLLDDLTVSERLRALSSQFPQKKLEPEQRFDTLIVDYYKNAFFWTRACILYKIGQDKLSQHTNIVLEALEDPEPLLRETALWALNELDTEVAQPVIRKLVDDESADVARIARELAI